MYVDSLSFCKKSLPQTVVFPADPPIDLSGGDHVDSPVSNLKNTEMYKMGYVYHVVRSMFYVEKWNWLEN